VTFTTNIGRIEPAEARTQNGQVKVKFFGNGQSGIATITAFSGGASGKFENLLVGSAAAERVLVSASPQTLEPAGGTAQITARVEDAAGSPVVGVPVTFSTNAGRLSATSVNTDDSGVARTSLNTTREATVTANVAGKTAEITIGLNPRTGISITGPTNSISAGLPASFTVSVGGEANVRDVTVDFGDGRVQSLGALSGSTTVQHTYVAPGTYTVTATATEATGFTEQVATSVTILPAQPPGVVITPSTTSPTVNQIITITATVSGATSTILEYQWDFGDGTTATTTGPQITKSYGSVGTKVIRVTVVQAIGPSGQGQTTVDVRQ
jgi:PKD repeat protein